MNIKELQRQTLINLLSFKGLFYQECRRRYINKSNAARHTSRITKPIRKGNGGSNLAG